MQLILQRKKTKKKEVHISKAKLYLIIPLPVRVCASRY